MTCEAVDEPKGIEKPEGAPTPQTVVALPVSEGQELEVEIISRGEKGDGIARVEGFVVFVPGTNPGDQVKVRVTAVRRRFATAEVVTE